MIRLDGLSKAYSCNLTIIEVDDFEFERGDLIAITGPNGTGKSTLLLMLSGLLLPTAGSATIDDHAPGSHAARAVMSFVPDRPALFDDLTISEQMFYVARLHGLDKPYEAAIDLLEVLDAEDLLDRFSHSLSKGQRQKAGLLVATSRPFDALLLDEPVSGLDADSESAFIEQLVDFAEQDKLVLVSTHTDEVIDACTRVTAIVNGELVEGDAIGPERDDSELEGGVVDEDAD